MERKRLYISLGFDVTNFLSSLLDRNFTSGDSVVVVVPKKRSERNEEAIKRVELLLSELRTRGLKISMEVLELDEENAEESLGKLIKHIKSWRGITYLDAVGGLRVFCVLMVIAGMLVPNKQIRISSVAENTGKRVKIPKIGLYTFSSLSRTKLDILVAIKRGAKKLEDVEGQFGKDKSTMSRHLASLEEMGLIKKVNLKPAEYEITATGEIILDCLWR